MSEGVDFSAARPGGAALVAAGKTFVMRYVPYDGEDPYHGLTSAEVVDYQAHNIAIGLVFESVANRALGGYAAGVSDGNLIVKMLAKYLPMWPKDRPIYMAVDWDAQVADQSAIDAYLRGTGTVLGMALVGVYAGYYVVNRCKINGSASWFWQTYAWSGGHISAYANVYQYQNSVQINGEVDLDRSLVPDFGQWPVLPDTGTGATMNSYPVPSVPSLGDVADHGVLYPTDACDPADPNRIVVFPGPRSMPYHGTCINAAGKSVGIVEYVTDTGAHTGKAFFIPSANLTNIRPVPAPAPTDCSQQVADAKAQQKAIDDAACATSTATAVTQAKQAQWDADNAGAKVVVQLPPRPA